MSDSLAHDIQVKVMLTPEEFLALKQVAEDIGTSQSALLRMAAKEKIRAHAHAASIRNGAAESTDKHSQV